MSGQSIVDRLNAAKHTVAGSALGRAVVKATTEEIIAPKKKHLDYLIQCTSEINVSIPQMADLLIERTQNSSWVVSFKSLVTIHHLMCYGNERFCQYMASHSSKFTYIDRTSLQGMDMSSYIRKYANYLNEKRETYRVMGFDFCRVKRGKDDGLLRTMQTDKLLKTLPILHKQLEALLGFEIQANELNNGVINSCFVLMSKDLIRLFACYNDGVINLLEKFFDMNKKSCKEALDIYKKFLEKTDNVSAFLKVAESSGMDKGDIPDLTKAPSSLLEALENHVNSLENKKSGTNSAVPVSSNNSMAVTNAINTLNSNTTLTAEEKKRVIEEEAKALEQLKNNHLKKQTSATTPTTDVQTIANGTSQKAPSTSSSAQSDLFGFDLVGSSGSAPPNEPSSASDDLLMLSGPNPFIQNIVNQSYNQQPQMNFNSAPMGGFFQSSMTPMSQPSMGSMMPPMNSFPPTMQTTTNPMTNSNQLKFDAFGDVLQPNNPTVPVMNPTNKTSENKTEAKIILNDLESSLASLADNLDINGKNKGLGKNHQWNSGNPANQMKTGGQYNSMMPAHSTTMSSAWGQPQMNNQMMAGPANGAWMGVNPFGAPVQQTNQMNVNPPMSHSTAPPVTSANNPFGLL